jgi:hypothetical protein
MSSARSTIESVLEAHIVRQYPNYVDPVVRAFEDRDADICESLRQQGVALGAREEDIEQVLVQAGLVEPAPEPEAVNAEPQSVEAMIASVLDQQRQIMERLDSASRQAQRHGIEF